MLKVVAVTGDGAATTHGASNQQRALQVLGAGDSGFPSTSTAPATQVISPVVACAGGSEGSLAVAGTSLVAQCPCWSCRDAFRASEASRCILPGDKGTEQINRRLAVRETAGGVDQRDRDDSPQANSPNRLQCKGFGESEQTRLTQRFPQN